MIHRFFFIMLLAGGCSVPAPYYPKHPLVDSILKPRAGFKGLTNRYCAHYADGECKKWEIEERLFEDKEFQKVANELNFICNVAGRRFKICMEAAGDQPGLCHITYKRCFLCKPKRIVEHVPSTRYQFLLDSNVTCFSEDRYPFEGGSAK